MMMFGQLGNPEIEVFNQKQTLDVVDIRDGVRAHLHPLTASNKHHRIYNVCRGMSSLIEQVVENNLSRMTLGLFPNIPKRLFPL